MRENTPMTAVRVCIDESYTPASPDKPLILSGCVSSVLKWDRFDSAWKGILRRYDLPYIHAEELVGNRGRFKRLSARHKQELAKAIDHTMTRHLTAGFSSILLPEDFEAYKKTGNSNLSNLLDSSYGVSFRVCISFLHSHVASLFPNHDTKVYVLAETGHRNSGAATEIFRQYQRDNKDGPVTSVDYVSKDCFGVQAADVRGYLLLSDEGEGRASYKTIEPSASSIRKYMKEIQLPWFRLPITKQILTDLRDNLILSRPKFAKLYGGYLSGSATSVADGLTRTS